MASMKDIKRRRSSIQSTQQITKAMKLVSTVKFQKSKGRAEQVHPYFDHMYSTILSILGRAENITHPYMIAQESDRKAVVVITANRGLAGGYNSNIVKLVTGGGFSKETTDIYAVGTKGKDALVHRGYNIVHDASEIVEAPCYADAKELCDTVLKSFAAGEIGEIYLAYTHFKNTVVHEPELMKLLPLSFSEEDVREAEQPDKRLLMNFEPNPEEALNRIIPNYVSSLFFGALVEAQASENAARMQAMDNATNNAEEMIDDLSLKYNRARQGSITQELTEIIAGAEAIS